MANRVRRLRVFVASPGDVHAERERMVGVVEDLNEVLPSREGVDLELWRWEESATPGLGEPQALINPELDEADIVVVILWTRLGTPTERGFSGTAEELLRSINSWKHTGTPHVMIYRCTRPILPKYPKQYVALTEFLDGLASGALPVNYESVDEFGRRVAKDLQKVVAWMGADDKGHDSQASSRRSKRAPTTSIDVERYLRHVETAFGSVVLTGLLGDKAAPSVPIEDIYVSLRARRPDLGRGKTPEPRHASAVEALREILETKDEKPGKSVEADLGVPVVAALRELGVSEKQAGRAPMVKAVVARLKEAGRQLDSEDVREILTTVDFEDAFHGANHLLIEGDPGSGKTTTLYHVAMALVSAHRGEPASARRMGFLSPWPLPVVVPLRRFRTWLRDRPPEGQDASLLLDFLGESQAAFGGDGDWLPPLLGEGRVTLLLDGVDEVPEAEQRERVAAILADFVHEYPKCRFVVTSRPAGLSGDVRRRLVQLGGLAHTCVQPLDADLQARFVVSWYRALIKDRADADRRAADLNTRIRRNPKVAELTQSPIMLTAVAVVHQTIGNLPERRADLYERCVHALSGRWDAARDEAGRELCGPIPLESKVAFLQEAAFRIHEQGENAQSIERGPLMALAQEEFGRGLGKALSRVDCEELADVMGERSGLLVPDGVREFRFRHLTFQEFLAARCVCDRADEPASVLGPRLPSAWWREVIPLAAAYKASYSKADARGFVRGLTERALAFEDDGTCCAALASVARALLDLREYKIPDLDDLARATHPACVRLIEDPTQPGEAADRSALGDLLGSFGPDPRLTDERRWVLLPGGSFRMGSEQDDAFSEEKPVHSVEVPAFEIHCWPATVAEFAAFLEVGGYGSPELWNEAGWKWREDRGVSSPDAWERQCDGPGNRPVVGISWWEAQAYCRFLGARLPSEAEWEYACRAGATTRYWSGRGESDLARVGWYAENSNDRLHAVGEKPANPWGLYDVHGNVWEWCEDAWHNSYEASPSDGRAWLDEGSGFRAVRGGCWVISARGARSAARDGFGPGDRDGLLGFRPARSVTS